MTTQPEQRDARDVVRERFANMLQAPHGDRFSIVLTRAEITAVLALATQPPQRDGAEPVESPAGYMEMFDRVGRRLPDRPVYFAPPPDERDAEIARLRDENAKLIERQSEDALAFYGSNSDVSRIANDLTAARAQCERATIDCEMYRAACVDHVATIDLLESELNAEQVAYLAAVRGRERDQSCAQCDAFKADAERYERLLGQLYSFGSLVIPDREGRRHASINMVGVQPPRHDIDAAIDPLRPDDAMRAREGEQS